MVQLDAESFDHEPTGFVFRGAHAEARCDQCHTDTETWLGASPECRACHEEPHGAEESRRTLLGSCGSCHGEESWKALPLPSSVFDHRDPIHADYLLEGACHQDWRFVPVPSEDCTSCHADPHRTRLGACTDCHQMASWAVSTFDHDRTRFPLRGLHEAVACTTCHGQDTGRRVPHATCEDCHEDVHQGQFAPRTCDSCHTVDIALFALPDFDHGTTDYPLHGKHAEV
ncbi:MAG: hypothetical protein JRI25_07175, partial [Deltaproteobacteria bacterium]|nr:hypothetical protein [Deltaproteobacteria bacterium]